MAKLLTGIKISKRILLIPATASGFLVFLWITIILEWKYLSLPLTVAGIIMSFLIAIFVSKSIRSPIRKMNDAIAGVANGHLTKPIDVGRQGELGEMGSISMHLSKSCTA